MKRLFTLLILISLILTSCAAVDINLTRKDNVYDEMVRFIQESDEYRGKSVKLTSNYTVVYNFSENKIIRHNLTETSPSGSSRAIQEIVSESGSYPIPGSRVTVTGTFNDSRQISVKSFENAPMDDRSFDIDTLTLTATELNELITSFGKDYHESEYFGQSVRVYGHCVAQDGYYYLLGLDANGGMTWTVELYDPNKLIPAFSSENNNVNAVEAVGKFSTYTEDNLVYACIELESIIFVEGTLS